MGTNYIYYNFQNRNKYCIITFPNGNKCYKMEFSKWEQILYILYNRNSKWEKYYIIEFPNNTYDMCYCIISKWGLLHTAIYCYTYQSQYKHCT